MKWLVSLLFLAIASGDRFGVCASEPSSIFSNQELRVAVIYSPPFSMEKSPAVYTGFSVELWEKLAATLKLNYVYVPCATMPELIQKLESGQLDVAVTNMVVTSSRLKLIDFTQPYFNGGLRIMVNADRRFTFAKFYEALDKYGYIEIFLVFAGILLALTYVVTLFQRRLTKDFPQRWHEGLADWREKLSLIFPQMWVCSIFSWHDMQRCTSGFALSRASGMTEAQSMQTP